MGESKFSQNFEKSHTLWSQQNAPCYVPFHISEQDGGSNGDESGQYQDLKADVDGLRRDVNGLKASLDRLLAKLNPVYDTLDDEGNIIEEPDEGNFAMFSAAQETLRLRSARRGVNDHKTK